ncbi:hypothetical protein KDX27_39115 [Burkholderia cenocepacia]|uniref:hypothetical protein n=1 Tax=Burkholderia cenocepacia TaxID=95486 RepID=UPI001B8EB4D8|nr:hypothetical protein [Burkholderia cenocepacia]MBR8029911.1 hypothetical protein [Burkholderia cenocepacia]MBR8173703.1 hypothetical protein [Burkholderia cenocepacia]
MTDDGIKAALLALTAKTKSGQLRELLPLIEAKVAAGVRHEDILAALGQHGFSMSMAAYKTTLYRIRKERAQGGPQTPTQAATAPARTPEVASSGPIVGKPPTAADTPEETGTQAERVHEALTNQQLRDEKFSKYSSSSTLSKRLGQKKES